MSRDNARASEYLRFYESERYTFVERSLRIFNSITVPPDAEQFADVSFWQAGMDWDEYKRHARAAIIRIGQNVWKDSEFETNYREAKERRIALGGYFFFDGRATPSQQFEVIRAAMSGKSFEMELFIDWERNYGGENEGLSNVVSLMQKVEAAGIKCKAVGLYTGYYYFLNNRKTTSFDVYLRQRPLWLAWYAAASVVKVPPPWDTWTHWQYGTPAVGWGQPTAEIDMNRHNGTKADFESRYLGGITPPPPTGGTMEDKYYKVIASAGLNIRSGAGSSFADIGDLVRDDIIHTVSELQSGTTLWKRFDKIWKNGEWSVPPASPTNEHWSAKVWGGGDWMKEVADPSPAPPPSGAPVPYKITIKVGNKEHIIEDVYDA